VRTSTRTVVAGVVLVLAHYFLHVGLGLGRSAPDLALVGLLLMARQIRVGTAAGVGLLLGLLEDALSVLSFGANAVALTVVGLAGALTRDLWVGDSMRFMFSYLVVGKWIRDTIHWVAEGGGMHGPLMEMLFLRYPLSAVYAAAVGVLVWFLIGGRAEVKG
jgi:rod shape-determining protein MreD